MPRPFRSPHYPSRTLLATALMLAGLSNQAAELTDMIGRTVQAPDRIDRVFAVAPPVVPLVYAIDPGKLVSLNFPFKPEDAPYVSPAVKDLLIIGRYTGEGPPPNPELLAKTHPQLSIAWDMPFIDAKQVEETFQRLGTPGLFVRLERLAETTPELPMVTVTADGPTLPDLGATATVTRFDAQAVRESSSPAASSPFKAVANAPSVNFQSADPHGLTEVGFHETIKIHGVGQTGPASSRNIDNLPITVNPGGSKGILDMENVSAITLYRGAAPVDKSLGFSNLPGKIDLMTRAPESELATEARFEGGTDDFRRFFLRQDSGRHGIVSGFLSGSFSAGDKWKGEGDFERRNVFAGLARDWRHATSVSATATCSTRSGWMPSSWSMPRPVIV